MKTIIQFLLILISTATFGQSLETLQIDTKKMYEATYNMAYEELIAYTHPKVFEYATKEQMLEALNTTFENDVMKIRFVTVNPKFTYSEIIKFEEKSVAVIRYNNAMRMTFEEKFDKEGSQFMVTAFKESGKYKIVNFEKNRNSFYIEGEAIMIAVADKSTNNTWKYINYDATQKEMITAIIGNKILKDLGL